MRDIRADLRERLEAAEAARKTQLTEYEQRKRDLENLFRSTVAAVEDEIVALQSLLEAENRRHGVATQPSAPSATIGDFFVSLIRRTGPKTKDELRDAAIAAGYFGGGENPGRSTHAVVLNLVRGNRLKDTDDNRIGIPEPQTLEEMMQ